uniref:Uncharacterized protein n=1 Tax=Triticum urartu TaxID=4572 RepID=A0A8R7Q3Z1_TRIUA
DAQSTRTLHQIAAAAPNYPSAGGRPPPRSPLPPSPTTAAALRRPQPPLQPLRRPQPPHCYRPPFVPNHAVAAPNHSRATPPSTRLTRSTTSVAEPLHRRRPSFAERLPRHHPESFLPRAGCLLFTEAPRARGLPTLL